MVFKAAETAIQWSSYKEILWKFQKIPKKILLVECTFKLLLIILKLQVRGCFWSSCHTTLFVKIIRSKLPMGCVLDRMMASKYRSSRPEVFCRKAVLKRFTKFIGKHLRQSLFFNKVADRPATFLKKRFWHRCFPVHFVKFLRTLFS